MRIYGPTGSSSYVAMSAKPAILEAARHLASTEGPMGMTIDRVIEAAQISKGGFFYHFASKDEMVTALVYEEAERLEATIKAYAGKGHRLHKALMLTAFDKIRDDTGLMAVFIAAVSVDRRLATFVSDMLSGWTDKLVADGLTLDQAVGVRLLIDGMFMTSLLYEGQLPESEFAIVETLIDRIVPES